MLLIHQILQYIKEYLYVLIGTILVVIIGMVYLFAIYRPSMVIAPRIVDEGVIIFSADDSNEPMASNQGQDESDTTQTPQVSRIRVYIAGEVSEPGVYELEGDDIRVVDVLDMAGGPTEDADLLRINLAAVVADAQRIIVPNINKPDEDIGLLPDIDNQSQQGAPIDDGFINTSAGRLVNINTASAAQLETLSGVGPVRAQSIISYRETHGGFKTIEEIMNVSGIGEVTFNNLKEFITV